MQVSINSNIRTMQATLMARLFNLCLPNYYRTPATNSGTASLPTSVTGWLRLFTAVEVIGKQLSCSLKVKSIIGGDCYAELFVLTHLIKNIWNSMTDLTPDHRHKFDILFQYLT